MVSAGESIISNSDALKKVSLDYLFNCIRNPKPEIAAKINQLRKVISIDSNSYRKLKRFLPYFVCANFNPPFRKTENFTYTEHFIIDIDHISQKGLNISNIRSTIEKDERVVMCFISPSEDGLKVIFNFKEKCYDSGLYSVFYKKFIQEFSSYYNLNQVVDTVTSDVCRACFISIDEHIYYNPKALPIDFNNYIDLYDPKSMQDAREKIIENNEVPHSPDEDEIKKIKDILNKTKRVKSVAEIYVPKELENIIANLKNYIEETGLTVTEIININYGKKIKLQLGVKMAEINLFYGKRGFTVVISPRTGTNHELNALVAELIENYIANL